METVGLLAYVLGFEYYPHIAAGILLVDKVVALSPIKRDDLIWSSAKSLVRIMTSGRSKT